MLHDNKVLNSKVRRIVCIWFSIVVGIVGKSANHSCDVSCDCHMTPGLPNVT